MQSCTHLSRYHTDTGICGGWRCQGTRQENIKPVLLLLTATVNVASGCSPGALSPSGPQAWWSRAHRLRTGTQSSRLGWKPNLFPKAHSQQLKDLVLKKMFGIKNRTLSGDMGIFQNLFSLLSFPIFFFSLFAHSFCLLGWNREHNLRESLWAYVLLTENSGTVSRQKVNGTKLA